MRICVKMERKLSRMWPLVVLGAVILVLFRFFSSGEPRPVPTKLQSRHKLNLPRDHHEVANLNSSIQIFNNKKLLEEIEAERRKLNAERQALKEEQEELERQRQEEDDLEAMAIAKKLGLKDFRKTPKEDEVRKREERIKYLNSLGPADPAQYQGLDSGSVRQMYPGIVFLPEYRIHEFLDPKDTESLIMKNHPKTMTDVDDYLAEQRFYELVGEKQIECLDVRHMGNKLDGGWDICLSAPYEPTENCLIYSFGINNDFTFDDAMMYAYGCHVMAFDPSMTIGDHKHNPKVWFYQKGLGPTNTVSEKGWKLETMASLLNRAGHSERVIDVLKIDIDYNEWACLKTIYTEKILKNVKQFVLEIHTPEVYGVDRPSVREDYFSMYETLLELEKLGFRRFEVHYNHFGQFISYKSGKHRTCCYEMSYININFLTL